jgi:hypothetical protein
MSSKTCANGAQLGVGEGVPGLTVGLGVAGAQVPKAQLRRWPVVTGGVRPVGSHANCVKLVALFCVPIDVILPVCVVVCISA